MNNFDWIAPVYDGLSRLVFGRRLQRAQTVFLNQIPDGAAVLLLGGGTGELLVALLAQQPDCSVTYLEPSARMVARAIRRVLRQSDSARVSFQIGDETTLRSDEQFDVVITPFVLDLFTEETLQNHLVPCLSQALKPSGNWFITDFITTSRWWQQGLIWAMIHFFRLTARIEARRLANWQQLLSNAGLTRTHQQVAVWNMVSSEVWTPSARTP